MVRGRGPDGVPDEVIARLSAAFNMALADPKVTQRLSNAALETVGGTPDEMARRMKLETLLWAKAAEEAGLGTAR